MNQAFNAATFADAYTTRREVFGGRDYVVAPVTILTEGVHAGSNGPIFYPPEELSAHPSAWDGIPVTLGHPKTEDGFVSANSPKVLEEWAVGRLFNTAYNADKKALQSEIWVDELLAKDKCPEVLTAMEKSHPVEVSTGLFFDTDATEGVWNGESFSSTAKHYRPNHLAILPDSKGACSCADGCGIRANEEKMNGNATLWEKVKTFMSSLSANEGGSLEEYQRKANALVEKLNKQGPMGNFWHYIEATYPDEGYLIVCQSGPEGSKYFKVSYEEGEDGLPKELGIDFTEMKRETSYVPVTNASMQYGVGKGKEEDEEDDDPIKKMAKKKKMAMNEGCGCDSKVIAARNAAAKMKK